MTELSRTLAINLISASTTDDQLATSPNCLRDSFKDLYAPIHFCVCLESSEGRETTREKYGMKREEREKKKLVIMSGEWHYEGLIGIK